MPILVPRTMRRRTRLPSIVMTSGSSPIISSARSLTPLPLPRQKTSEVGHARGAVHAQGDLDLLTALGTQAGSGGVSAVGDVDFAFQEQPREVSCAVGFDVGGQGRRMQARILQIRYPVLVDRHGSPEIDLSLDLDRSTTL